MSDSIPQRRKLGSAPQGGMNALPEYPTAKRLMQTYYIELTRYNNLRLATEHSVDPQAFARDFGDISSERKRAAPENIEANPSAAITVDLEADEMRLPAKLGKAATLWLSLARGVLEKRIDPQTFIRRQFAVLPAMANPPRPEAFVANGKITTRALKAHESGRQSAFSEVRAAFCTHRDTFSKEVVMLRRNPRYETDESAWAAVLEDLTQPLSALFRYCIALSVSKESKTKDPSRFATLAKRFEVPAAIQYVYAPEAYDEVWKQLLPPRYRQTADSAYRKYYKI